MKRIILDTDLDTDCDDAGALAVLHNLRAAGMCQIAAVICNAPVVYASSYARVVNAYYDCPAIETGIADFTIEDSFELYFKHREKCEKAGILYNESIVGKYSDLLSMTPVPVDAIMLYRKILSGASDASIDICAIGLLNVLAGLIDSGPCAYSDLSGIELIRRKVAKLVVMGKGVFPVGKDSFNWKMAPLSAAKVLNNWPGRLVINPIGDDVLTGGRLMDCDQGNPVSDAYRIFLCKGGLRPSWDPVAVLFAVLEDEKLFSLRKGLSFSYDPISGVHKWSKSSLSNVFLLESNVSKKILEGVVDNWLLYRPVLDCV